MAGSSRIRILVFAGFLLATVALAGLAYAAYRSMDNLVSRLEQAANPDPYYQALQTVMRTATTLDARVRSYTMTQRPEELISEVRLTDSLRIQIDSLRLYDDANPRLDTIAGLLGARVILMDSIVEVIKQQEGPSAFAAFYDRLRTANSYKRNKRNRAAEPTPDTTRKIDIATTEPKIPENKPSADDSLTAEDFAQKITSLGYALNGLRIELDVAISDSLKAKERVDHWVERVAVKGSKYAKNRLSRWQENLRDATITAASIRADYNEIENQASSLVTIEEEGALGAVEERGSTVDSVVKVAKPKPIRRVNVQAKLDRMMRQAAGMAERDSLNRLATNTAFLRLTDRDMTLTEDLLRHLGALEQTRQAAAENRADYARGLSKKTRQLAAVFGISMVLIFALLLGVIFRDLNRNRKLQNNLKVAKGRAEQLARAKEEFLANMSHEIRTPMNAIIGFSDALGEQKLTPEASYSQQAIARSADHLLALLNDILDLSKLEAGQVGLEAIAFSPEEVCRDVISMYEQQAKNKGLYLNLIVAPDVPKALSGDPLRLRQILLNLVSNALKFTEEGGVSVYAHATHTEEHVRMRFDVRDTGPGIPPEAQARIFKAFEQADSTTARQHGGTGLGLAISARLARLQNGSLTLKSTQEKGATFTIDLPYAIANEKDLPALKKAVHSSISFDGARVLAADDDLYNRELLEMLLKRWGMRVDMVEDGEDAVKKGLSASYDLILLDLRMPGMGGLEAADRLRKAGVQTPIVALTATATIQDREAASKVGIQDVLLKPFQAEALAGLLQNLIPNLQKTAVPKAAKSKPEKPAEAKTMSAYDPSKLEQMANGNEAFVKKMLGLFVSNAGNQVKLWDAALASKDWQSLSGIAHQLAPSVRQLGHTDFYKTLKSIEAEAENPKADTSLSLQAKAGLASLKAMLADVEKDLKKRG
ncbi:MAG: ATP-binding protein [Bacteroidia bacterium]